MPRGKGRSSGIALFGILGLLVATSSLSCLKKKLSPVAPPDPTPGPAAPTSTATATAVHRAWLADTGNNRIVVIEDDVSAAVTTFSSYGAVALSGPTDVSVDTVSGDVWIADNGNGKVRNITPSGLRIATFDLDYALQVAAIPGTGEAWALEGNVGTVHRFGVGGEVAATSTVYGFPSGLVVDLSPGNFGGAWACAQGSNAAWKVGPAGAELQTILAGLGQPFDLAVDPNNGSVWVVNSSTNALKKFDSAGNIIFTYSGSFLIGPRSIAVDPRDGGVWVADGPTVLKVTSAGGIDVPPVPGFSSPRSLAVDPGDGSVWISDFGNNRVVKLRNDGVQLGVIDTADGTPFSSPEGIALR